MKLYYSIVGVVEVDASDWSEGADEVFSIARKLSEDPAKWWVSFYETTKNIHDTQTRVLTPEGGV